LDRAVPSPRVGQEDNPLRQEGRPSLGEGGDGSNLGTGAFSEGVVIAAFTTDATDDSIEAHIASVYGK
jgi:hypothetical protein